MKNVGSGVCQDEGSVNKGRSCGTNREWLLCVCVADSKSNDELVVGYSLLPLLRAALHFAVPNENKMSKVPSFFVMMTRPFDLPSCFCYYLHHSTDSPHPRQRKKVGLIDDKATASTSLVCCPLVHWWRDVTALHGHWLRSNVAIIGHFTFHHGVYLPSKSTMFFILGSKLCK